MQIVNHELVKFEDNIEEIIIPEGITAIRDFAFYNLDQVVKVIIPDSVESIGEYAFNECISLKEIIIPKSVKYIGGGAFSRCIQLENIVIPESIRSINKSTFYKCDLLKNVKLPSALKYIEHSAFSLCLSLSHLSLPEGLLSIGDKAFEESAIEEITIPSTVTKIGSRAFFHCVNLEKITLLGVCETIGEGAFQTHGNVSFISNDQMLLTSKMFDFNWNMDWNYSFKIKNGDNYCLVDSYLPQVNLKMWKPFARIVLLVNFLETYDRHLNKDHYLDWMNQLHQDVLEFIILHKRYAALNNAIINQIIDSQEIEPYFDSITDREQKAKLLEYSKQSVSTDDLDSELDDLFS